MVDIQECHIALREAWNKIFATEQKVWMPEEWETKYLKEPKHILHLPPLQGPELHKAALEMKKDSVSRSRQLASGRTCQTCHYQPTSTFALHLQLHQRTPGLWPKQQSMIWLAPLAKGLCLGSRLKRQGPSQSCQLHTGCGRLPGWSSIRSGLRRQLPSHTHAYLKGKSALTAALAISEKIEEIATCELHRESSQEYHMLSLDCSKAFPTTCRKEAQ